ncbi:MAG: hypothetical protein QXR69_02310, partial [Conexivisphaerales archaeon]
MQRTHSVAIVSIFVALILGSNYLLAPLANVKLEDTMVFVASYLYGIGIGASVAILAETAWSTISPYGFAGAIMPFLVAGELIYAIAGYFASKIWNGDGIFSSRNIAFGSIMAVCAFIWDFETNAATGLIAQGGRLGLNTLLSYEAFGLPFMISHELSDFAFGAFVAPAIIYYATRRIWNLNRRLALKEEA